MDDDANALREKAAIARRLAAMGTNDALRRQLDDLAEEYDAEAREAERGRD
jgi:hypothetical protein